MVSEAGACFGMLNDACMLGYMMMEVGLVLKSWKPHFAALLEDQLMIYRSRQHALDGKLALSVDLVSVHPFNACLTCCV